MVHELTPEQVEAIIGTLTLPGSTATVKQALRGALGGYMPAWTLAAMARARQANGVLQAACEAADDRERERSEQTNDAGEQGTKAATNVGGVRAIGNSGERGATPVPGGVRNDVGPPAGGVDRPALHAATAHPDPGAPHEGGGGRGWTSPPAAAPIVVAERGAPASREGGARTGGGVGAVVATWALAAQASPPAVRTEESSREGSAADLARAEAAALAPGDFGYVLLVDQRCQAATMPPMSPWWRASIEAFFSTGKPWGIWNVGRGGGKSSSLERVAAAVARYSERHVPPGQTWTVPFVSVGPDDANRRINGIAAVFRADGLRIVGDERDDGGKIRPGEGVKISRAPRGSLTLSDVRGNAIQLASVAGTVGNLSGPSTVFLLIDEAAKLHDGTTNANPLTEIIASAAQTSRGRAGWRAIVCSSAWEKSGVHHQMVEAGDNEVTYVAKIGAAFIDLAVEGFESVAVREEQGGDLEAARLVREYAATVTAASPNVPTWVANPTLGNPEGIAWDGAALASRRLVQQLPEDALDGVPRVLYWLRENGSVPLDRGSGGAQAAAGCRLAAELTAAMSERGPRRQRDVMPVAGAPPGDARYAGPSRPSAPARPFVHWSKRDVL